MIDVKDRDIVVPGQLLGDTVRCENAYGTDGKTYSLIRGLARIDGDRISLIPLDGPYIPKPGDVIVGVVEQDLGGVYLINIGGPYYCILKPASNFGGPPRGRRGRQSGGGGRRDERPEKYVVGDLLSAKVTYVDEVKEAQLTGPRRLSGGCVVKVKPKRVPRIIGKKKSMINLIRDYSGARISVGQNGLIWMRDGNVDLALQAIRKVEAEAYTSGLTDRITQYLKGKSRSNVVK
jgi:exosome complex component RRP4